MFGPQLLSGGSALEVLQKPYQATDNDSNAPQRFESTVADHVGSSSRASSGAFLGTSSFDTRLHCALPARSLAATGTGWAARRQARGHRG